jgi:hypothetical protein
VRRTTEQSERQVERQTRLALAVVLGLLVALFAGALAAAVATSAAAGWVALMIGLGCAAVAAAAWLTFRIPAEMRILAGERRRALDDLLRAEEGERERIATQLRTYTYQVITGALVTIDRVTPALGAHDTERVAQTLPPARRAEDRRRVLLHLSLEQLGERVRLADGDLRIRSIPGRGTLVAFRLPIARPALPVNRPAAAAGD